MKLSLSAQPTTEDGRRRQVLRSRGEAVLARARHLPGRDRALVEALVIRGEPAALIARLLGVGPKSVQRRADRLVRRLASPGFAFIAARLGRMPALRRSVAVMVLLHGRTQRDAAKELGVSIHEVRRHVVSLKAQCEALEGGSHERAGDAGAGDVRGGGAGAVGVVRAGSGREAAGGAGPRAGCSGDGPERLGQEHDRADAWRCAG